MSSNVPKTRKPRKNALYSQDEIAVINKYKEEYGQQMTRELRGHVFKTKILVDLFNFWLAHGIVPVEEEESLKRMKVNLIFSN